MTIGERLWKTFNKALGQYQLIDEDDHILVACLVERTRSCCSSFWHVALRFTSPTSPSKHFTSAWTLRCNSLANRLLAPITRPTPTTCNVSATSSAFPSTSSPPVLTKILSRIPSRSPLAFSAPGSAANSSSTSLRSCTAQRLPLVTIRTTSSTQP